MDRISTKIKWKIHALFYIGLFQKKIKRGGGGLRIWNFQEWSRKTNVEFLWVLLLVLKISEGFS